MSEFDLSEEEFEELMRLCPSAGWVGSILAGIGEAGHDCTRAQFYLAERRRHRLRG